MTRADHVTVRTQARAIVQAGGALASGIERLEASHVPSAALAAELLLLHVLGRDRTWLYAHPEHALSLEELTHYDEMLKRRAEGVPVQYLTGRQEFWGLEFEVNPNVLIPRPETEHVVEVSLARFGERRNTPLCIADVGTGSGCIAVALARELPLARIVATDISPLALQVARRNAARHGVGGRIRFLPMNLLESYTAAFDPPGPLLDFIVSNPPYIGRAEAGDLPREVLDHEPHEALFAGEHGLDAYPQLAAQAASLLRPGGSLVVELGYGSAEQVRALVTAQPGWSNVSVSNDLAGIPRVLAADRV